MVKMSEQAVKIVSGTVLWSRGMICDGLMTANHKHWGTYHVI